MTESKSTAEYISFAAKMGATTAPLPRAATVRSGPFMKANPEMVIGWREFGMGCDAIAAQLTLIGMPISGHRVKRIFPDLEKAADKTIVAAIASQLRLMFMSARMNLAEKADAAYIPTMEIPSPAKQAPVLRQDNGPPTNVQPVRRHVREPAKSSPAAEPAKAQPPAVESPPGFDS